ncbi:MFS transporter [Furfurilactobacillus rossiae]|uniref:Glycoside-Pentoside-hexuronide (GPH) cation symporter family protein n=1 Tax=Furfurilactobacillus rossiae DSM 15814 TaxID=1114972 RepID=A0A0R1R959_9LACO|nr:MFS transporter [Furfurilactobacillus rossiae]KRL53696.1 glycoside-Pentoside-hexuronide (GPH) cation symporter family protein [Furfurilactobacillus rossiae DSM 15814]QFR67689.1 MFS transporter [Furfurilactobacillus rossiae]QLE60654.1 Glycoside-Pentoside-Hexuronide GPH [Furfurilactobacillus rossiae]
MKKTVIPLKRLIPGLIIGPASWLGPYIVMNSLFLPALIQHLNAANKVNLVALFSTCGMIVAAISNMIAGALSDRTKSRFGKRAPWILGGATVFMLSMILASFATNIPYLLIAWMIGQSALNFIVAPMVAWLDLAPKDGRGTASSAYGGLGMALGNNGFTVIGALFLSQYRLGFILFGIFTLIGTLIAVLIVHEPSSTEDVKHQEKKGSTFSFKEITQIFPKWAIGRDYYLALIGKLFQGVGNFAITGYILYIMTDFLHRGSNTQSSIQLINTIMLIFGILMGFVAGPISDKFKILKFPVAFSTIFLALGAITLFLLRNNVGIIVYAFSAGIGMGVWNSLDNLLNLEVIPDPNRVAFFLGVYNLGNTVTQAIAPVIAALVISWFGFSAIFIVSFIFSLVGGISMLCIKSVKR